MTLLTTADLGRTANPLASYAPPGDPADFVVYEARPVWREHIAPDGTHFDKAALERVCRNCNERILDTGDFSAVAIRHTTEDGGRDPEVVGFAGPFFVGRVGNLKPRWAILCTLWIYREDAGKLKKYPRLSVEYWSSKKDPTDGYFDPISLLGAETPELDLGIRYSKSDKSGMKLMRYCKVTRFQATAAGGSNTYVPGGVAAVDEKKKPTTYQKGGPMLDENDLKQIVQALVPVIKATVDEAMAAAQPPGENSELSDPALASEGGDAVDLNADPNTEPDADPSMVSADAADPAADGGSPVGGDVPGDTDGDGDVDLADDAGEGNGDDTDLDLDGDGDSDLPTTGKPSADKPVDDKPSDDADSDSDDKPTKKKYQKLRSELNDYRAKYQKEVTLRRDAEADRDRYKAKVDSAEAGARKATRYQKLNELNSQGYVFEVDEEAKDCEGMNDQQFAKHCDKICSRYQRVPLGRTLPQDKPKMYDGNSPEERVQRYSKQAATIAAERVEKARAAGQTANFLDEHGKAMKELAAADTGATAG